MCTIPLQHAQSNPIRIVITGNDKLLSRNLSSIDMSSGDIFIMFGAHLSMTPESTNILLNNIASLPFTYKILAEAPLDYLIAGGVRNILRSDSSDTTITNLSTPLISNLTLTDTQEKLLSQVFVLNGNATWMHGIQIYNASYGTIYRPMIKRYDIVIVPMLSEEVYSDIAKYNPHVVLVHDQTDTPLGESRVFQVLGSTVITMNSANPLVLTLFS